MFIKFINLYKYFSFPRMLSLFMRSEKIMKYKAYGKDKF